MTPSVFVTGGSGFIGTWVLRDLLQHGARPVVVDPHAALPRWQRVLGSRTSEVVTAEASLLDPASLLRVIEKYEVTQIIHMAALLTPACQQDPFLGARSTFLAGPACGRPLEDRSACGRSPMPVRTPCMVRRPVTATPRPIAHRRSTGPSSRRWT